MSRPRKEINDSRDRRGRGVFRYIYIFFIFGVAETPSNFIAVLFLARDWILKLEKKKVTRFSTR